MSMCRQLRKIIQKLQSKDLAVVQMEVRQDCLTSLLLGMVIHLIAVFIQFFQKYAVTFAAEVRSDSATTKMISFTFSNEKFSSKSNISVVCPPDPSTIIGYLLTLQKFHLLNKYEAIRIMGATQQQLSKYIIILQDANSLEQISAVVGFPYNTSLYIPFKRFERDSIYWPPRNQEPISAIGLKNIWDEEIKAISKKIDDEEKLERLNDGKESSRRISFMMRPIQEKKYDRRLSQYVKSAGSTLSTFHNTTVTRLFEKTPKGPLSPKRDRRGLRSDQVVNQNQINSGQHDKQASNPNSIRKRGFSYSRRLDFSRPQNFNPGPGSYKIVRFLQQERRRSRAESKEIEID